MKFPSTNALISGVIVTVASLYVWEKFVKPRV